MNRGASLLGLPLVIAAACGVSLVWVFTVPIYQSPDEWVHLDYALAIYSHGGPFLAQNSSFNRLPPMVHPYTAYLKARTRDHEIAFSPGAKFEPGYGTTEYFAALDRDAPKEPIIVTRPNHLAAIYPFGYYTILAGWIGMVRLFTDSLTVTFFAARIFSVVLLSVTLTAVYGTTRLLNFSPRFALVLTAGIGLFPLTSFVSSYVQPDNLSWALVTASYYFALRGQRGLVLLGLALGVLAVTKAQFFVCTAAPIIAMLSADLIRRANSWRAWLRTATIVLLPSLVLGSAYLWTVRGTENFFGPPSPTAGLLAHHSRYLKLAIYDFFGGVSHDSFWGVFGWNDAPLVIRGPGTTALVQFVIRAFGRVTIAFTLVGIARTSIRLVRVARRKRAGQAIQIALNNPVVNSLFAFTAVLTALYVHTENRFGAQGRNWLPVILPIFLLGIAYAPRALAWRPAIRVYTSAALAGLLLYDAIGGYYAIQSVRARYYVPFTSTPTRSTPLSTVPAGSHLVTRSGNGWECSSADAYLAFRIGPEQFVHGIRLEFQVTSACAGGAFRVVWRDGDAFSSATDSGLDARTAVFSSPVNGVPRGATVWTNGPVREFRIYPDDKPCRFEITAITVIH